MLIKIIFPFFILFYFSSCSNKMGSPNLIHICDTIQVDKELPEKMFPIGVSFKGNTKQTQVEFCYLILSEIKDSNNYYSPQLFKNCTASLKNDTLSVDIGYKDGFSGKGISLTITKNKFSSGIFKFSDNIIVGEAEPQISINYQKLILSKASFNVGDTVLGRVFVNAIDNKNKKYYAAGYFSTIITKTKSNFLY